MSISQEFKEAVENKDNRLVRIMLKDILVADPTLKSFDSRLSFAQLHMSDLYDEHEGELNCNQNNWNKEYMNDQMVELVYNFSKERVDHIKLVCQTVYVTRISKIQSQQLSSNTNVTITQKQVGTSIATVGGVITVAGAILVKPLVVAAGVATVVVGGIIIATDNDK